MTVLHTREAWNEFECAPRAEVRTIGSGRPQIRTVPARRPRSQRPAGVSVRHRGTGVRVSRAPHRRRRITPVTTVLLALVAGGITLWLGLVAQFGGVVGAEAGVPGRLAVVQVQTGESLQQVAQRIAPGAPVGDVVESIRELNELESVAVNAGQTLIAPVG